MPRNGSGTYSKVNTFAAGATITSSGHNQNWDDLVAEMTNSVAADGQTSMTGALKAASGTAALPGVAFAADTNTGIYRKGSDNLGIACAGAEVLDVTTTGVSVTGDVSASGAVKQAGFSLLPVGVILPYGGLSAPTGYLLCYGQSLLRASYPDLFTALGTTWGAADGTHFNVPDLRGRVPAAPDNMGGSAAGRLDATGGMSGAGVTGTGGAQTNLLTRNEIPTGITSTGTISGTAASTGSFLQGGTSDNFQSIAGSGQFDSLSKQTVNSTLTGTASVTSNNTSGAAHLNVQPTIAVNYIIFAGV